MKSRPFLVELAGLPAAGKTTLATLLLAELVKQGYRCAIEPEAATHSPLRAMKRQWQFNAWTSCQAVTRILELSLDRRQDVIILDRGLYDSLCWIQWFRQTSRVPLDLADKIEDFIQIPEWFDRIGAVVVLRVDFAEAIRRRGQPGRIVNAATFQELRRAYDTMQTRQFAAKGSLVLDTDDMDPALVLDRVMTSLRPRLSLIGNRNSIRNQEG